MDKKAAAAEIKRLRKQAEDKSIPQEARNEMLDKANEIEYEFYKKEAGMAKGGAVKKPAAKKTTKMAKGGYANCGASMKPSRSK